jgi:rhamnose transport system permease protein
MKKSSISRFFSRNIREFVLIATIIIVSILVQMRTNGVFLSTENISDLLRESAILLMVSMGMMIIIVSGNIDVSLGSVMGLCGMLGAMILRENQGIPIVLLFIIVMAIGFVCGSINGFIVARLHLYPLIATLATQYIFRGVIYLFSHGNWVAQADMTPGFISVATTDILGINSLIWFAIVIVALVGVFLRYTYQGRYLYAVGNSALSASITGIKINRVKIMAFMIMGTICGLAGLLWICKYGNAQSESCSGYEMSVIAAAVVGGCAISGGTGTVFGVVLGALLIGTLNNILPLIQVTTYWQSCIKGFVILVSIIINAISQKSVKRNALRRRVL